jgi:transcriptional regulator with GAF, ATPase, and Fis domain
LYPAQAWPELDALRAQVGLVPLEALLQDAADVVERRIVRAALQRAAGQVDVAARLLRVDPLALSLRLHHLDLLGNGSDDAIGSDDDAQPPRRMN